MAFVEWNESVDVHVDIINKQHKHFIDLINKLYECLGSGKTDKISSIINDLTSYTLSHFKTEEDLFDKFHYEGTDDHRTAHHIIKTKVREILERQDDPKAIGFDLLYLLERWLFVHIKGMDKKYTDCFHKNGLR